MKAKWVWILAAILLLMTGCDALIKVPVISLDSPADGASKAVLQADMAVLLKWTASDPQGRALVFDVYSGTTAAGMTKKATTAESQYNLTGLSAGTQYYWKIVADNGRKTVDSETRSFTVGGTAAEIKVIDYITGPMTPEATVQVLRDDAEIITGTTDADGCLGLYLPDAVFDILVTKETHAPSKVYNYKPSAIPVMEIASNRATTDYNDIPEISVNLLNSLNEAIPEDATIIEDNVQVHVASSELMDVLYLGLGFVPSSLVRTGREIGCFDATIPISLSGTSGTTVPLHVVAYTVNRTRVDRIVYLPVDYTAPVPAARQAPADLAVVGYTSDYFAEYYGGKGRAIDAILKRLPAKAAKILQQAATEHAIPETNIYATVMWTHAPDDQRAGYNIYRNKGTGPWRKVGFVTGDYFTDKAFDLQPGETYHYKVATLYADGIESEPVESGAVVPLDLFKVKLISPADNDTNVDRVPLFQWKPVAWNNPAAKPAIGGSAIPDEEIYYMYACPWIYDMAVSDQHIFYYSAISTIGPAQVSLRFLLDSNWTRINPAGEYSVQTDPLEKAKTYEWGLDAAFAYYENQAEAVYWYSVTIDYGYGFDFAGKNEADSFNRFTTTAK